MWHASESEGSSGRSVSRIPWQRARTRLSTQARFLPVSVRRSGAGPCSAARRTRCSCGSTLRLPAADSTCTILPLRTSAASSYHCSCTAMGSVLPDIEYFSNIAHAARNWCLSAMQDQTDQYSRTKGIHQKNGRASGECSCFNPGHQMSIAEIGWGRHVLTTTVSELQKVLFDEATRCSNKPRTSRALRCFSVAVLQTAGILGTHALPTLGRPGRPGSNVGGG